MVHICGLIIFSVATYTDCRYRVIPDILSAALLLLGAYRCVFNQQSFLFSALSAAGVLAIFIATCLITDAGGSAGVGGGDIKLMTAATFVFGISMGLWMLLLSHLMACLYILLKEAGMRLLLKKRELGAEIFCSSAPMAPFFLISYICYLLK